MGKAKNSVPVVRVKGKSSLDSSGKARKVTWADDVKKRKMQGRFRRSRRAQPRRLARRRRRSRKQSAKSRKR